MFCVGIQRKILSNSKEKSEYSSKCPSPLKDIIKETKSKFEVSIIDSKKLYNICSKIANKNNLKLPEVHSLRAKDFSNDNNIINKSKRICSPILRLQAITWDKINPNGKVDTDKPDISNQNLSSRVLDKEQWQANYKFINERMRRKIRKFEIKKHTLLTFNASKLRLKSPIARQPKCLI